MKEKYLHDISRYMLLCLLLGTYTVMCYSGIRTELLPRTADNLQLSRRENLSRYVKRTMCYLSDLRFKYEFQFGFN